MMAHTMLLRRTLMAITVGSGSAWLGGRRERVRAMSGSEALAAVCAGLSCTPAIGEACLQALPGAPSKESLEGLILADTASLDRTFASARAFTQVIRARSRKDFRNGRIAVVGGWMLSLTETRLYALAALASSKRVTSG